MKQISVLGSTGSIGCSLLDIIEKNRDKFKINLLSCAGNIDLLAKQAISFDVPNLHVLSKDKAELLRSELSSKINIFSGAEQIENIISDIPSDLVVNAIVGAAGLEASYHTLKQGINLALANKESLIAAGELLLQVAKDHHAEILPIDSEHSAIWQCLRAGKNLEVEKIILTASGGPFRTRPQNSFSEITVTEALNHPNWSMGSKISIDSATMMNKGLEVIEAYFLFGFKREQIEIVVHPESIIHSMVQFIDGSQIAQLSPPDMRLPIAYALHYPDRLQTDLPRTDFTKIQQLTFAKPDLDKFPCITLAYNALEAGGTAPAVLNAANEIAVESFLAGEIKFVDIAKVIKSILAEADIQSYNSLEELMLIDQLAREKSRKLIAQRNYLN